MINSFNRSYIRSEILKVANTEKILAGCEYVAIRTGIQVDAIYRFLGSEKKESKRMMREDDFITLVRFLNLDLKKLFNL